MFFGEEVLAKNLKDWLAVPATAKHEHFLSSLANINLVFASG